MDEPIEIDVWQGEIAELEVDALIVAASESLFMTAGAAASVKAHGGHAIERAAIEQGPIAPGTAIVTRGGELPAAYVIHAVAVGHDRVADPETLAAATRAALAFAGPLQLRRVAVALLGVEHGVFTPAEAAAILVPALRSAAAGTPVESIVLATTHAVEARAVADVLRSTDAETPVR